VVSNATITHLGDLPSIAGHLHGEVLRAFDAFLEQFRAISRRAARRWGDGDWAGHQWDSRERLQSHRRQVERAVLVAEPTVRQLPPDAARAVWIDVRHRFARTIAQRDLLQPRHPARLRPHRDRRGAGVPLVRRHPSAPHRTRHR
jgi:hypothetical protein